LRRKDLMPHLVIRGRDRPGMASSPDRLEPRRDIARLQAPHRLRPRAGSARPSGGRGPPIMTQVAFASARMAQQVKAGEAQMISRDKASARERGATALSFA
jgi:hypothetical protein